MIPGYIEEIEKMLRKIIKTQVYENMIKEYQSLNNVEESKAREIVDSQLSEVQKPHKLLKYVKEMDFIDKKINNYYSLYSTRILMVLSNSVNMQTYINDLLMTIKDLETEEKKAILGTVSKCFGLNPKHIGRKSIERRKKRKPNTKSGAIITSSLSEEEKARLTRELLYEYPNRYGVKQAADYFDQLFMDRESVIPDETVIKNRDDAMMVAASIIYSGSDEFPMKWNSWMELWKQKWQRLARLG